jgi:hypothetical protein
VQDGTLAQMAYAEAIHPATSAARRQELLDKLLAYCHMDTLALVRLVRFFQNGIATLLLKNLHERYVFD